MIEIVAGLPKQGQTVDANHFAELAYSHCPTPDPLAGEAALVVRNPLSVIKVEVTGPSLMKGLTFSIGDSFAVVTTEQVGVPGEVAVVTVESIPMVIADTVGLGPTPADDNDEATLPRDLFETFLHAPHPIAKRLQRSGLADVFTSPNWRMWSIEVETTNKHGEPGGYSYDLFGTPQHGWWFVHDQRNKAVLEPARSAFIWRGLCDAAGFHQTIDEIQ